MATAMLFGPEWMRTKQTGPTKPPAPSPPLPHNSNANTSPPSSTALPGASSYSSLVAPQPMPAQSKQDVSHPFKYSKEQMLAVWRDGGGGGALPIDVERWEGIVREDAVEPATCREMSDLEKKLFSVSLNSEMRRRQSTDHGGPGERPKLNTTRSAQGGGSLADGLGLLGRRRRVDSSGTDPSPLTLPRKSSWSAVAGNPTSPGFGVPRSSRPGANGFEGGVLNSGDGAWGLGKRRTSTNHLNAPKSDSENDAPSDTIIKEEPEAGDSVHENPEDERHTTDSSSPEPDPIISATAVVQGEKADPEYMSQRTPGISLGIKSDQNIGLVTSNPEPNIYDPLTVNWTYLDPMGNIQGPFPAETMQMWHEQQYFTDDLQMKRVDIDKDWITVADIKARALGERPFVAPLSDNLPPPGLQRLGLGVPLPGVFRDINHIDSPRQPAPQSFGTPNSYFAAGSASPASSFGVPAHNGMSSSPDPFLVGGRVVGHTFMNNDINLTGRISSGSFSNQNTNLQQQLPGTNQFFGSGNFGELDHSSSSYDANFQAATLLNVPWQTPAPVNSWDAQVSASSPYASHADPISSFGTPEGFNGASVASPMESFNQQPIKPRDPFAPSSDVLKTSNGQTPETAPANVDFDNGLNAFSPASLQPLSMPIRAPSLGQNVNDSIKSSPVAPSPAVAPGSGQVRPSAWGPVVPQERRISPFDVERPRATNTFVVGPKPLAATSQKTASTDSDQTTPYAPVQNVPWLTGNGANKRTQESAEPQSLTTANVLKHEEQHKGSESIIGQSGLDANHVLPAVEKPAVSLKQQAKTSLPGKQKQGTTTSATVSTTKAEAPSIIIQPKQSAVTTPVAQPKSPWAITDDAAASPVGLREIQEAEKKRQEARRQAELEKERASRAAAAAAAVSPASAPQEEVKFSTSWGLPSSHMGSRAATTTTTAAKDAAPAQPVWSNSGQPSAKKTMKEIQEEEERRRILSAKDTAASAAKKTAAAAAASKVATAAPATVGAGGVWSVVGSGGKSGNTPSVARTNTTPQPSTTTGASAANPSSQARTFATPALNRMVATPQISKTTTPAVKVVEEAPTPSADFLKWLRDSLREVNSSVQVEEITQMLLSFPLDPDASTVELITELIHGASTTLHGRRFASDFVTKRKEDAAKQKGTAASVTASAVTSAKPTSLADVVRSQPKPAPEFTTFKVVKKKGKRN